MKIKTCLLFCLFGNIITAQDPTFTISSDCPNYNSFVDDPMLFTNSHLTPPYEFGTLYTDLVKKDSLDAIMSTFGLDEDISFQLQFSEDEYKDNSRYYSRFQEYYKGLLVEGGGITVNYIRNKSGDPSNPCDILYSLAPRILSGFIVNTNPSIPLSTAIGNIHADTIYDSELIIAHNLDGQCEFKLAWRINYIHSGNRTEYIDAHSGQVLLSVLTNDYLTANTINYGPNVELNNFHSGTFNSLESSDRRIKIIDFDNPNSGPDFEASSWNASPPSITTSDFSWGTVTSELAYQALYVGNEVIAKFDDYNLGEKFTDVRIGTSITYNNGFAEKFSNNPYPIQCILLGGTGGSNALPDIIAHELIHIYLRKFLASSKFQAGSLHEAICDMFGTFIESKIQGYIDWAIGDDDNETITTYHRNLSNPDPRFDCFTEVENNQSRHDRSVPLGYWFYLISHGKSNPLIPALGIDVAFEIILSSLQNLNDNSDYRDLMQSTLSYILKKYGRCSNEFKSISQAWELICITTGSADNNGIIPDCSLGICGKTPICEEADHFEFCVCGEGPANSVYNWTIVGPKSTEYSSSIGMQGNSQNGGQCLTITDIPKYSFYPQYIKIRVHSPTMCNIGIRPCYIEQVIKLNDCANDDPHCDYPYTETIINSPNSNDFYNDIKEVNQLNFETSRVKIYDTFGRQLYDSSIKAEISNYMNFSGLCFFIYFNKNGEIVKTIKKYLK